MLFSKSTLGTFHCVICEEQMSFSLNFEDKQNFEIKHLRMIRNFPEVSTWSFEVSI